MTRRTRPNRERRALAAQGRTARRARFRNLIDRAGRLTLTPQEADALRGAAEAEFTESDNLRHTVGGQQSAMRRLSEQLDAAHEAIREAEQYAADLAEQLRMYRAVEEQRQADADTFAGRLATIQQQTAGNIVTAFEQTQQRAETAEATLDRIKALAHRMRAGSPQRTAAIYADRIEQTLGTTPEAQQ